MVIWSNSPAQSRVKLCQVQSLSSEVFTIFKDGYFTTPLNSLFQCLTALLLKKFSLIPGKNFPCLHLRLLSLIQPPCTFKKKSSSIFVIASHHVAEDNKQMSPHTSPNGNTQFFQPLVHHVLHPCSSLAVLHWTHSSMPMLIQY